MNNKIFLRFNPRELCKKYGIYFESMDNDKKIDCENWPDNLIYVPNLICDEKFYQTMWSDNTLTFHIESAIRRLKSLASRSLSSDEKWEHSDILCIDHDDKPEDNGKPKWSTKTEVLIYLKKHYD